jgi:hypothetical protein
MKLAVYADSKGQIMGLAICQLIINNDLNGPREISISFEPLQKLDSTTDSYEAASHKTHIIELPSHLANKPNYELSQALHDIHASMRLDLTHGVHCFCCRT